MRLFQASTLFSEAAEQEIMGIIHDEEKLKNRVIEVKKALLQAYCFKAYQVPKDFTASSYIIASNHLTDSDAPLIMSYYYKTMHPVLSAYPQLFVFAKENCFNGVSISQELKPILELEKVFPVDRGSLGGSMAAMKAASKWYTAGEKPKHFLIFSQGTIYDINRDKAEDIEPGAFWLSRMLGIPVLPAFLEQAIEGEETRMVFGTPIVIPAGCRDFVPYQQLWLERVIEAQDGLADLTGKPARTAVLDADHQTRKRFVRV